MLSAFDPEFLLQLVQGIAYSSTDIIFLKCFSMFIKFKQHHHFQLIVRSMFETPSSIESCMHKHSIILNIVLKIQNSYPYLGPFSGKHFFLSQLFNFIHEYLVNSSLSCINKWYHHHNSIVCLTTGPQPLPKCVLHCAVQ
jgi:hypothetical protein